MTGTNSEHTSCASATSYSYRLDEAEIARYEAMAAAALEQEQHHWHAAGIVPGATVADLGCGPGTFLPILAAMTLPVGQVFGIDRSADATAAARALIDRQQITNVNLIRSACSQSGLESSSVDTVFVRNVLVHNTPGEQAAILSHARRVLRPSGHLLVVEPDITAIEFPLDAADERDLELRWAAWARSTGRDPAIANRLDQIVTMAGFDVEISESRVDELEVERSPAWTALDCLVDAGFATEQDVARWNAAIEQRLVAGGALRVRLPLHLVVATPRS